MPPLPNPLPADRLSRKEIVEQIDQLPDHELIFALLHAVQSRAVVLNAERQILLANEAFGWAARAAGNTHYEGMRVGEALGCVHREVARGGCGTSTHCLDCGLAQATSAGMGGQVTKKLCLMERQLDERSENEESMVSVRPLDESGPARLVCVMTDISDAQRRRVMETALSEELQGSAESVRRLAEVALEAQAAESDNWRQARAVADAAILLSRRLEAQNVLLAAEKGELGVQLREVDSAGLVRATARKLETEPVAARRRILCAGEPGMKLVTDPALLRRALEQLLVNALEATPDGGTVKAMVKPLSKGVRIEIWNEGVMTDSVQRQVFKRSFTTKQKGTGLGAYSAKLYVERYLSGRVGFRSSNGDGTTFWLDLTGE
ncbi:MAG: ATP-binding protein [Bryobacteraceae bacterium]|nr:hypothetical protein [Solibacteraceae bacterium]MCL4842188.1 hypothetical protein [Bryobacteraceae bacterium]MCO5352070.1 ATP-binding protein [Bryobacteraceae bacterium]